MAPASIGWSSGKNGVLKTDEQSARADIASKTSQLLEVVKGDSKACLQATSVNFTAFKMDAFRDQFCTLASGVTAHHLLAEVKI